MKTIKDIQLDDVSHLFQNAYYRFPTNPLGCIVDKFTARKLHSFRYHNGAPLLFDSKPISQCTLYGATIKVTDKPIRILAFVPLPKSHVHPLDVRCAVCGEEPDGPFYCEEHK